jgi:hypothetical protein
MPRRDSTRLSIEEDDEPQLRRSLRTSTQRDAHHLNYDSKSHPLDEYTRPALFKRRLKAHKIPVIDLDSDGDNVEDDDSGDDDDTISYGSRTRKRRSTSSRQSAKSKRRRSNGDDDRQRCSNLDDIKRMTKVYCAAWEVAIKDLSPTEQLGYQASQYESAWEQFAMPAEPPVNDDAISIEDDEADDIDAMMMPSTQLNNGLNNFDLAFNGTQRSAMSAADSLQDHLDEELTDVQPKLHVMSEPRSSFPPVMSPPTSGRAKKTVDAITIHEDPPSTAITDWSRQHLNRVQSRHMSQDEQKENDVQDEEEAEEAEEPVVSRNAMSRLPSRTSTGATESTIAQHASPGKSSESNTRNGMTPAERGRSVRGSSSETIAVPSAVAGKVSSQTKTSSAVAGKSSSQRQNRTVYDDSEEESDQDETGKDKDEEAVDDDEESEDSEEEDDEDDEAVKSEPVSSSARR